MSATQAPAVQTKTGEGWVTDVGAGLFALDMLAVYGLVAYGVRND